VNRCARGDGLARESQWAVRAHWAGNSPANGRPINGGQHRIVLLEIELIIHCQFAGGALSPPEGKSETGCPPARRLGGGRSLACAQLWRRWSQWSQWLH